MKKSALFERYAPSKIGETGRRSEKKVAKSLRAELTRASGAVEFDKGDFKTKDFLFEAKSTIHKSMSLKQEWLTKIKDEAMAETKYPAVVITFVDEVGNPKDQGTWVAVPQAVFELMRNGDDVE